MTDSYPPGHRRARQRCCLMAFWLLTASLVVADVEEAEQWASDGGVYRDTEASGAETVVRRFGKPEPIKVFGQWLRAEKTLFSLQLERPPGLYDVTFYVMLRPLELMHRLSLTCHANDVAQRLHSAAFGQSGRYLPIRLCVPHAGGKMDLSVAGYAESGFDGMLSSKTADEAAALNAIQGVDATGLVGDGHDDLDGDAGLAELEGTPMLSEIDFYDLYAALDRIEIDRLGDLPARVTKVQVDKVHYLPAETAAATVTCRAVSATGDYTLSVYEVRELDRWRLVHREQLALADEPRTIAFSYTLDEAEYGRQLLAVLTPPDVTREPDPAGLADPQRRWPGCNYEVFGVSRNVYRIGITAEHCGQSTQHLERSAVAALMAHNQAQYANYFERFAWAPCDYADLTPDSELFWAGQGQYPGSISGQQLEIEEAHKVGIKVITYGKCVGGGIAGYRSFLMRPEYYLVDAINGLVTDTVNTFLLECMVAGEYGGWQEWMSLMVAYEENDDPVDFGADEILRSAEMFGWDGVRWDGHFEGKMARFKARVNAALPNFIHAYNIANADPGSARFIPYGDLDDFREAASGGGMMMDESVRNYSHTNWSQRHWTKAAPVYFYSALCREADYVRRLGGLPLYILFDMASELDQAYNVLFGLAAGETYTYQTTPGSWPYGNLTKWLTRYSAFVWCDAARVATPRQHIAVTAATGSATYPLLWEESCWLRTLDDRHQQLQIRIVNPPQYAAFCQRAQPPSLPCREVSIAVTVPAAFTVSGAAHLSPDLTTGQELLPVSSDGGRCALVVPEIKTFSVIAIDLESDDAQSPAWPPTDPVGEADAFLATEAGKAQRAELHQRAVDAAVARTSGRDKALNERGIGYEPGRNDDLEDAAKPEVEAILDNEFGRRQGLAITRNGRLDLHHCRGVFSWLNKVDHAFGLLGGGERSVSWLQRRWFGGRVRRGIDEFPDSYAALFANDILLLDNLHSEDLGLPRRVMIRDYVAAGGGLLVFGGYFNLSCGLDHLTWLEELMPVSIAGYRQLARRDGQGFVLAPAGNDFFPGSIDWSAAPRAFTVDTSPVKDNAEVLLRAGDHPAIVSGAYGKGRVVVVLINQHGIAGDDRLPYWQWHQWPRLIATCLHWLAPDAATDDGASRQTRQRNPDLPDPTELLITGSTMPADELTPALLAARPNIIDRATALDLLDCLIENCQRLTDTDAIATTVDAVTPWIDAAAADRVDKLLATGIGPMTAAGLRLAGLTKQPPYIAAMAAGLQHDEAVVRHDAVTALGALGGTQANTLLRSAVADQHEFAFHAVTQLVRNQQQDAIALALPLYVRQSAVQRETKRRQLALEGTLFGGMSFKLTIQERKRLTRDYVVAQQQARRAVNDMTAFEAVMAELSPTQLDAFCSLMTATADEALVPLLYQVNGRLPAARRAVLAPRFAAARLATVRMLQAP